MAQLLFGFIIFSPLTYYYLHGYRSLNGGYLMTASPCVTSFMEIFKRQETSLSPDFSWSVVHAPVRPDRWVPALSWGARPPRPHPAQNTIHLPATKQDCSFDASLLRAHGGPTVSGVTNSVTQAEPYSSLMYFK